MQSHFFRCRVEELVAGQIEAAQRVHAARAARRKQIQKPPDAHGTRLNHLVPAADGLMEAHVLSGNKFNRNQKVEKIRAEFNSSYREKK